MNTTTSTTREPTVAAPILLGVAMFGMSLGVDAEDVEEALGVATSSLLRPDARLPYSRGIRLWRLLEETFPERPLGLELASQIPHELWGTFHFATRHAPTLSDAVDVWVRYHRVVSSHARVERDGPALSLHHQDEVTAIASVAEFGLAFSVRVLHELAAVRGLLEAVELPHQPRGDHAAYEAFFAAPVHFGRPFARLTFRQEALGATTRQADPILFATLQAALDRALDDVRTRHPDEADPISAARSAIAALGATGVWSSVAVAATLGVSLRTLQRQMRERGVKLRTLVDEQRKAAALRLLRTPRLSLDDVAFLCGYADERSFSRAFKRWTGLTPVAFREAGAVASIAIGE